MKRAAPRPEATDDETARLAAIWRLLGTEEERDEQVDDVPKGTQRESKKESKK